MDDDGPQSHPRRPEPNRIASHRRIILPTVKHRYHYMIHVKINIVIIITGEEEYDGYPSQYKERSEGTIAKKVSAWRMIQKG